MTDRPTDHQMAVARRTLTEESALREHLVVALTGAHAYGFASVDSDLDLKAVHVAPTGPFLGFGGDVAASDRLEVIDGVEIDYTSNEVGSALRGVLSGNGNMIERLLDPAPLVAHEALSSLRSLIRQNLSQRIYRHYHGFATNQRRAIGDPPRVKKVLYVLRTALTGAHALMTGEVVPDLSALGHRYGFSRVEELIAYKRAAEDGVLPDGVDVEAMLERAFVCLDEALERSALPEEPPTPGDLERWLIEHRLQRL
jgi:uncharacterized protein